MKLVVFGLTISSSWGNGHATLWRGLCRALASHGHQVVFFEKDAPYYAAHRDYFDLPSGQLIFYSNWQSILPRAWDELGSADVGIVTSYCPDGVPATELLLSSNAEMRIFYDLDTPVTLSRLRTGQPVDYIGPRGLSGFDLVLSYTGGRSLDDLGALLGARRVAPLFGSVDPEVHHPVPPTEDFSAHCSYLGTYAEDRQAALEKLFIEPARRLSHLQFLVGGAMYPNDFPWTSNLRLIHHVAPPEHPAFYCSSRLTVNVTRGAMAAVGYCPSGRLFEAAACGVPILSDYWEGLEQFFRPGSEILVARDTHEATAALELPVERLRAIGDAARLRALNEHTAEHRALELECILEAGGPWETRRGSAAQIKQFQHQ